MLDPTTIIDHPENIVVELQDGTEIPVQKIYYVGGRAECFKVLVLDREKENFLKKIENLEHDCKVFEDEKDNAEAELSKAEKQLEKIEEKHEKEFETIQSALDTAQENLGIGTSERLIQNQIDDLFGKLQEKLEAMEETIRQLELDNTALAWNIDQHEKTTPSTLS